MARVQITELTLKNGETLQIPLSEGQNVKKQKAQKPLGSVILPSQKNRLIDCTYIVDIKELWVGYDEPQTENLLKEGEKPVVDKNSPGYKKFVQAKENLKRKMST